MGIGFIRVQFSSKAVLHRPERIDVTSSDAFFRRFTLSWLVEAGPSAGCRVSIVADLELRSRFLQQVVERVLPATVVDMMAAFEARARGLYTVRDEPVNHKAPRN
jgi:coenzyme Q-binding protein COQ10